MVEDDSPDRPADSVTPTSPRAQGQGHADEPYQHTTEAGTYYAEFDPRGDNVALEVILGLEEVTGEAAINLPVLTEFIDPEALNDVFQRGATEKSLQFDVPGYSISVHGDGQIIITPNDETA